MRGIILAAGRGSRMGRLTATRPKCLIRLGGRSLLDWQLEALDKAGIAPVAVVRGYRGEQIRSPKLHYFENPEWDRGNIVTSLQKAEGWLAEGPCLVAYGDILYHPEVAGTLRQAPGDVTIVYDRWWRPLWEARFSDPREDAESFQTENGLVTRIGTRGVPIDEIQGQYTGLFKLTPEGWRSIEGVLAELGPAVTAQLDMTALLEILIQKKFQICALATEGKWCEVDRPEDVTLYREKISSSVLWSHDWREMVRPGSLSDDPSPEN